jgi:transcriptional regulator with XRE-family HTH domain/tetratricopeptide (TPR) repeat protein
VDGAKLTAARKRRYWSQERAAEALNVGRVTLHRWEQGRAIPQGENLRNIYEIFGLTPVDLGIAEEVGSDPQAEESTPVVAPPPASYHYLQALALENLYLRLRSLTSLTQYTYQEVQYAVSHIIKEDHIMNASNPNHHIKRREVLKQLIAVPILPVGLDALKMGGPIKASPIKDALTQYAMSIAACWELAKSNEHEDLASAFHGVSAYLPTLQQIVKDTTKEQQRKDAAGLAAQCLCLKAILAMHLEGLIPAKSYAEGAVLYGQTSGDRSLHIVALLALASNYYHSRAFEKAWQTGEQARALMEQPAQQALPALVKAHSYSLIAWHSAANQKQEQQVLRLFEKASRSFSDSTKDVLKPIYFDCTRSNLVLREGLVYRYLGNYQTAANTFAQIETLAPGETIGRTWVEIKIHQASVALMHPQRDMEETTELLIAGLNGARKLQSEKRFSEACQVYTTMECLWPHETRIHDLRDLIQHW